MYNVIAFRILKQASYSDPVPAVRNTTEQPSFVPVPYKEIIQVQINYPKGIYHDISIGLERQLVDHFTWLAGKAPSVMDAGYDTVVLTWYLPITFAEFLFDKFKEDTKARLVYLDHYIHTKENNGRTA